MDFTMQLAVTSRAKYYKNVLLYFFIQPPNAHKENNLWGFAVIEARSVRYPVWPPERWSAPNVFSEWPTAVILLLKGFSLEKNTLEEKFSVYLWFFQVCSLFTTAFKMVELISVAGEMNLKIAFDALKRS